LWSVASQVNNSHFIIEHSTDGRLYSENGKVQGHGNTPETKHYTNIHEKPSKGINYNNIKQVEYDGKYSYSDIASVRCDGHGETIIYPNPAISEVIISITASTSMQVMNVYGRLLLNQETGIYGSERKFLSQGDVDVSEGDGTSGARPKKRFKICGDGFMYL
jgi:hypothetical protein